MRGAEAIGVTAYYRTGTVRGHILSGVRRTLADLGQARDSGDCEAGHVPFGIEEVTFGCATIGL
jgi:hypothetical protein